MRKFTVSIATAALAGGLMLGLAAPAGASSGDRLEQAQTALSDDMGAVADAATSYDLDALEVACSDLQVDAGTILDMHRPRYVPRRVWRLNQQAMRLTVQAGAECEYGAANMDTTALVDSTDLISQSTDLLDQAAAVMEASA